MNTAAYLCAHCGIQFAPSDRPPVSCPICQDERQYIHADGQRWLTLAELRDGHRNEIRRLEPGLTSIRTEPAFAMGHQALLVQSSHGNVLWDCVSLLDDETISAVRELGGISAIAISHPHFYDTMVEWSRVFGDAPLYLHEADRAWVMRPDPAIRFWSGRTHALNDDMTVIHCGGHFEGSAVLHWPRGAENKGALLTGDTIAPVLAANTVTFMRSFPNMIPLSAAVIRGIVDAVDAVAFDRLYGIYPDRIIARDAKAVVRRSAERHLQAVGLG